VDVNLKLGDDYALVFHEGQCYEVYIDIYENVKTVAYPYGESVSANGTTYQATAKGWQKKLADSVSNKGFVPTDVPFEVYNALKDTKITQILKHELVNGTHYTIGITEGGIGGNYFFLHSNKPVNIGDSLPYHDVDSADIWLQHLEAEEALRLRLLK